MRRVWIVIFTCFCWPMVVAGKNLPRTLPVPTYSTYYAYEIDSGADALEAADGDYSWITHALNIPTDTFTPEEEAFMLFTYFFETVKYCIPEGVKVLGVKLGDECLTVNVSREILAYGGNAYEQAMLSQCVKTMKGFNKAYSFTLLVEGVSQPLAEGRMAEELK